MNKPPTQSGANFVLLPIKAVPGAKHNQIVGWLGDRLKVRISAPPEDGRANQAICALLAKELGVKPTSITITRGHSSPEKTARIEGIEQGTIDSKWPR